MKSHVQCSSLNILRLLYLKAESVCGKPGGPRECEQHASQPPSPFSDWTGTDMHTSGTSEVILLFTEGVNCHLATGLTPGLFETVLGKKANSSGRQPRKSSKKSYLLSTQSVVVTLLSLSRISVSLYAGFICFNTSQCLWKWN